MYMYTLYLFGQKCFILINHIDMSITVLTLWVMWVVNILKPAKLQQTLRGWIWNL